MEKKKFESKEKAVGSSGTIHNTHEQRLQTFFSQTNIIKGQKFSSTVAVVKPKKKFITWVSLSTLVRRRKAICFPLIYGVVEGSAYSTLLLEKPTISGVTPDTHPQYFSSSNDLIQIAMMFRLLLSQSIFLDNPVFDIIECHSPFTMSIFDNNVGWVLPDLQRIIVLSPKNELDIDGDIAEDYYLNILQTLFIQSSLSGLDNITSFDSLIHVLLETCPEHLNINTLELLRIRKRNTTMSRISPSQASGSLVLYMVGPNEIYYGITITEPDPTGNVRLLVGNAQGTALQVSSLEILEVPIRNVYYSGTVLTTPTGYYINSSSRALRI